MFDMAFTEHTLRRQIRRVDFLNFPDLRRDEELIHHIQRALEFIRTPSSGMHLIRSQRIGRTVICSVEDFHLHLVLRKLNANIRHSWRARTHSRDAITSSLFGVLSEGVPYRVYKLDVRRFFESISPPLVSSSLKRIGLHETATERVTTDILNAHSTAGGEGLPRGLSISAALADMVMHEFDARVEDHAGVFFYRRYVDDLTIVTSSEEDQVDFIRYVSSLLPNGLQLKLKKQEVRYASPLTKPKAALAKTSEQINYLGYCFTFDASNNPALASGHRKVVVDIASKKVGKIKSRVISALLDFIKNSDFELLDNRIRHLTSNLSMTDRATGLRRLVGIHFNYPLVDADQSKTLIELDRFLKNAIHSSKGRVYGRLHPMLSSYQRAALSRHSFVRGAKQKSFFQMGLRKLGEVQRCWKYA